MTNTPRESDIDCQIVELAQTHWKEHRTPLLLSRIGSRISREDAENIRSEYQNLAAYLRKALAADVQILQSDKNPTIIAAVPAEEEFSGDVDTIMNFVSCHETKSLSRERLTSIFRPMPTSDSITGREIFPARYVVR